MKRLSSGSYRGVYTSRVDGEEVIMLVYQSDKTDDGERPWIVVQEGTRDGYWYNSYKEASEAAKSFGENSYNDPKWGRVS